MKDELNFVMGINLIIWAGIVIYLFMLDRKVGKLEKAITRGKK